MKNPGILSLFLVVFAQFIWTGTLKAQSSFQKLIWSDEFNYTGKPDPKKWTYDTAMGCPNRCGWGNNEQQYYTTRKENASVANGALTITANREEYGGAAFTSARLHSHGKFDFTYGRVEVRAKLPSGIGTWPAAWMLGSNINKVGWPACGEIDIMEHRGYELNKIFGTFHYPGHSGDHADGNSIFIKNATSEFHVYAAEWTATSIRIYCDNELVHELKNTSSVPYHHPFHLILNLAIGGGFAGPVDPKFESAQLEIDYVRVYQ
jgi:beta-glucanase (GH16 family)